MSIRLKLIAAYGVVYLIWGAIFLVIAFGIETIPPFLMMGVRFLIAGILLYGWARLRGAPRPRREHWLAAGVVGFVLLTLGVGVQAWAQLFVPSGLTGLIVSTTALWMVLLDWLFVSHNRPSSGVVVGLLMGLGGVVLLIGPANIGGEPVNMAGAIAILIGSLGWAVGALYSAEARLPDSVLLATSMQFLTGSAFMFSISVAFGEPARLDISAISTRSYIAVAYLIVFASIIAFSVYLWLLRMSTTAQVATFAYVIPLVALILGWLFNNEPVALRTLLAAIVIIAGVILISIYQNTAKSPAEDNVS